MISMPTKWPEEKQFPVLYELQPIGVGGALEAVDVSRFCSDMCRYLYRAANQEFEPMADGMEESGIEGEHCCQCDTPLERKIV